MPCRIAPVALCKRRLNLSYCAKTAGVTLAVFCFCCSEPQAIRLRLFVMETQLKNFNNEFENMSRLEDGATLVPPTHDLMTQGQEIKIAFRRESTQNTVGLEIPDPALDD